MERKQNVLSLIIFGIFCFFAGGSITLDDIFTMIVSTIVMFLIVLAILGYFVRKENNEKINKINNATDLYKDFNPTIKITNSDNLFTFSIDKEKKKILIIIADNRETKANTFLLDYADIISVDLLEDSNLIYSKSTARTIGGGLVGGFVGGGTGALIGGLSGDSRAKKIVSNLKIKLLIRNLDTPSIYLNCYNGDTMNYDAIKWEAQQIISHLNVIIDLHEKNKKERFEPYISVPEEIEKLQKLKERGILSDEEFKIQKERILNKQ